MALLVLTSLTVSTLRWTALDVVTLLFAAALSIAALTVATLFAAAFLVCDSAAYCVFHIAVQKQQVYEKCNDNNATANYLGAGNDLLGHNLRHNRKFHDFNSLLSYSTNGQL